MKTGMFIKRMSLDGHITYFNMTEVGEVMKALRIIGTNINQIAKKANEINSIYAEDVEKFRKENEEICHTLNQFLSALPSIAA
ncbi:MAG: plasmid mobilization relaxosome protein MobC [Oscillospiraceae bacterium]|nr:plasmid mobilization relaxosome protein MobC [Oscillospiraceae bacterium]